MDDSDMANFIASLANTFTSSIQTRAGLGVSTGTGASVSTGTGVDAEPTHECPGLNRVASQSYRWLVPPGFDSYDRTYCKECCDKLGISGTYSSNLNCNCDSFIIQNEADNGVFNFSFWQLDKKKWFKTEKIPIESGNSKCEFNVKMPSGPFRLFVSGYNLSKTQYYKVSVNVNDTLLTEDDSFIKDSVLFEPSFWFVADDSTDTYGNKYVIKKSDVLSLSINIYNLGDKNFDNISDKYLGTYSINHDNRANVGIGEKLREDYDEEPDYTRMYEEFTLFTKKPSVIKFNMIPTETAQSLDNTISILRNNRIKELQTNLNKNTSKLDKLRSRLAELDNTANGLTLELKQLKQTSLPG